MEAADIRDANAQVGPMVKLSPARRNAVLGAVLLGLFLAALDQTIVGTALPRIVTDLHGNNLYTWVVTAYLLSSTISVPIYGKLSDVYGRKIMLMIGISIFLLGSALSGLSQDITQLIIFRAVQGLGAGALFPIALAVIGDIFTPRERGRYQGVFGAVFGLSFLVGPFVGGWITDNISWHWVFYVNIPIGLAALAVIATVLPNFHPPVRISARDLDYLGIGVFTISIISILLGLTNKGLSNSAGQLASWTDPQVGGLLVFGLVVLVVFLFIETKAKQPIIPLDLFKDRTYSATNIGVFMVSFGMFASIIFLPRFYQAVRGLSATDSGYMIWPLLLGLISSSIGSGILISKIGKYKVILLVAMVVLIVGAFLMTHIQANTSNTVIWFWMLLIGLGIGPSMSGFTVVVQNVAPMEKLGVATSTLTFLRQIGGSVGLAIAGTLFSQYFVQKLPGALISNGVPPRLIGRFATHANSSSGNLTGVGLRIQLAHALPASLQSLIPHIVAGVDDAFALALGQVFWLTFFSSVVALLAVIAIREVPLRGHPSGDVETMPEVMEDVARETAEVGAGE